MAATYEITNNVSRVNGDIATTQYTPFFTIELSDHYRKFALKPVTNALIKPSDLAVLAQSVGLPCNTAHAFDSETMAKFDMLCVFLKRHKESALKQVELAKANIVEMVNMLHNV